MTQTLLLADIEAAKAAILAAENELRSIIGGRAVAPRAAKTLAGDVIRTATSKLTVAKTKLAQLTAKLDALGEAAKLTKIETASAALADAERYLDKVLAEMELDEGADTSLVNKVVQDAFTKLRISKATLSELQSVATDET